MSNCPSCGAYIPIPIGIWSISLVKTKQERNQPHFYTRIILCSQCGTKFSAPIESAREQTASVKNAVERIKYVREELLQTIRALREKIQSLEVEKVNLTGEIEKLRKVVESRASVLELESTK
jgi:hypothetical protein